MAQAAPLINPQQELTKIGNNLRDAWSELGWHRPKPALELVLKAIADLSAVAVKLDEKIKNAG